jgi:hypothetical protein
MPEPPDFLDPLSEMIALSAWGNTKNLIVTAIALNGPVDEHAITTATQKAAKHFPRMRSFLRELKGPLGRRLAWEAQPDLEFPVHISSLSSGHTSSPALDEFLNHLAPRLERDRDLFHEPPGELHVLKTASGTCTMGPIIHHAASDGVTAAEFGRQILLEYHALVTGEKHKAGSDVFVLSSSKRRMARPRAGAWKDLAFSTVQSLIPYSPRIALPVGKGRPDNAGQHHIKRTLSAEASLRILSAAPQKGVSFVDLLAACADIAVDKWNDNRNVQPGTLTNSMTINMKGRYSGLDSPNAGGVLFFKTRPEMRTDIVSLAKVLSASRVKQLRKQLDFAYFTNVTRLANSFRMLPFETRRRLVHFFVQKHRVSVGLTFLGTVWPKMKNGKPTADTGLTEVGGLEITDVHAIGYKLLSSTPLLIIVYLFRNQINLVLAASASLLTRREGEDFLDLVIQLLLDTR